MNPASVKSVLNDITECSICVDIYKDPRTLPCIHTFCLGCLDRWTAANKNCGDQLDCPICRTSFVIPENGVDGFPKNFFIAKLLAQLNESSEPTTTPPPTCEVCSRLLGNRKSATSYCADCDEHLCQSCAELHRNYKVSRSHRQLPVADAADLPTLSDPSSSSSAARRPHVSISCGRHSNEYLTVYCQECRVNVCAVCSRELHGSHGQQLSDSDRRTSRDFRRQMTADVERLADRVDACLDVRELVGVDRRTFVDAVTNVQRQIDDRAEQLRQAIEYQRLKLTGELETIKDSRLKTVDQFCQNVDQRMSIMRTVKRYTEELVNRGTACDVAREAGSLHDRVDELMKFDVIKQASDELGATVVSFSASVLPLPATNDGMVGKVVSKFATKGSYACREYLCAKMTVQIINVHLTQE